MCTSVCVYNAYMLFAWSLTCFWTGSRIRRHFTTAQSHVTFSLLHAELAAICRVCEQSGLQLDIVESLTHTHTQQTRTADKLESTQRCYKLILQWQRATGSKTQMWLEGISPEAMSEFPRMYRKKRDRNKVAKTGSSHCWEIWWESCLSITLSFQIPPKIEILRLTCFYLVE